MLHLTLLFQLFRQKLTLGQLEQPQVLTKLWLSVLLRLLSFSLPNLLSFYSIHYITLTINPTLSPHFQMVLYRLSQLIKSISSIHFYSVLKPSLVTKKYAQTIIRQVVHISHFIFVPHVINRYGNFGNIFKYNYAFSPVLFEHLRRFLTSLIFKILFKVGTMQCIARKSKRVKLC